MIQSFVRFEHTVNLNILHIIHTAYVREIDYVLDISRSTKLNHLKFLPAQDLVFNANTAPPTGDVRHLKYGELL